MCVYSCYFTRTDCYDYNSVFSFNKDYVQKSRNSSILVLIRDVLTLLAEGTINLARRSSNRPKPPNYG